jgi:hypothetical protein
MKKPLEAILRLSFIMKLRRVVGAVGGLLLVCIAYILACVLWTVIHPQSLNRGLAEEKSYFKHAGTYYQLRRELRGQKSNLETWDEAEQIVATIRSKGAQGGWAAWSDHLDYMPQALRLDASKLPMCVIHLNEDVYVVRGVKKQVAKCEPVQPGFGVSHVRSGELVPSSDGIAEIYYERTSSSASTL